MRPKRCPRPRATLITTLGLALFLASCAPDGPGPEAQPLYRFQDAGAAPDIKADASRTWGGAWQDIDLDGDADLLAGRHWRPAQLFVNDGRRLRNHNAGSQLLKGGDRHGCAWGEANGDGRPDLYCVQGADKGTGSGPNQLFIQTRHGFEERAGRFRALDRYGRGRTANWIDFDSDGDLDLFVGNHWREGHPNQTLRNDGGIFTRVSIGLTLELATVGSSWSDWDNDGDPDLLLHQLEPKPTVAFENIGGTFVRAEIPEVTGSNWTSGAWGDYNGDGWPDLHLVSRTRSIIMRNDRESFSLQHEMRLNEGRMSAWLDAENDGDLDLYVVQGARSENYQPVAGARDHRDFLIIRTRGGFVAPLRVPGISGGEGNGDAVGVSDYDRDGRVDIFVTNGYFHSRGVHELLENGSRTSNWIGLDLVGTASNPEAIGARIRVRAKTRDYWRETNDGVNFRAQSEVGYAHLGIASNKGARIRVVWPDGRTDCIWARANSVRRLEIGSSSCAARS
jgi:hypothetical protein